MPFKCYICGQKGCSNALVKLIRLHCREIDLIKAQHLSKDIGAVCAAHCLRNDQHAHTLRESEQETVACFPGGEESQCGVQYWDGMPLWASDRSPRGHWWPDTGSSISYL